MSTSFQYILHVYIYFFEEKKYNNVSFVHTTKKQTEKKSSPFIIFFFLVFREVIIRIKGASTNDYKKKSICRGVFKFIIITNLNFYEKK